jgi:hypothetical protein
MGATSMAKLITRSNLLNQLNTLNKAIAKWEADESDEVYTRYGTLRIKKLEGYLSEALEAFIDGTADEGCDVAPDARLLMIRIDQFALVYMKYQRSLNQQDSPNPQKGLGDVWRALGDIREQASQTHNTRNPQPIALLAKQGVGYDQIAAIYGWTIEGSSVGDTQKVIEELEAPGTHYNPDTWVDPALRFRQVEIDKEWSLRLGKRAREYARAEYLPNTNWVPPSIETMIKQDAPPEQIANVHGISIDEARERLAEAQAAKLREQEQPNQLASV